nr:hypothetical protein [Escherichia coli]UGK56775.1 hypothetical protein [Escherichia coli]
MDYNIYTVGDIEFVWSALNGIALIFLTIHRCKSISNDGSGTGWSQPVFIKRGFGC